MRIAPSVLSSVAFYTNDFETTTQGVDLVATYNTDFGTMGTGSLTAAWNWTETEVDDAGQEVEHLHRVQARSWRNMNEFFPAPWV